MENCGILQGTAYPPNPDVEQGGNTTIVVRRDPATGDTDPCSRPPLVPPRTVPAIDLVGAGRCLSRMRGNLHVRF